MSGFATSPRTLGKAVALHTPVHFDAGLVDRLLTEQRELNASFASLVARVGSDPEASELAVRDCSARMVEVRRTEALWLYPVIARAVDGDADAQQQFVQMRLVMLRLARRTLRLLDDFGQAVRLGIGANAAADRVAEALAEYWQRNQAQIYPLYELVGTRRRDATRHAG